MGPLLMAGETLETRSSVGCKITVSWGAGVSRRLARRARSCEKWFKNKWFQERKLKDAKNPYTSLTQIIVTDF